MKKKIFICALFINLIITAQTTVTKSLGDFNIIKAYNGIELELIKSTEQRIEIIGEKSEKLKIKNVNNTLKLSLPFSLRPSENIADGGVKIKLYYNKTINIIDGNQGATITAKNFNQDNVELNAEQRAFINITQAGLRHWLFCALRSAGSPGPRLLPHLGNRHRRQPPHQTLR